MLKQPAYLYKNIQYLYTDLVTSNTGYRKMYARTLKLYKGIDNTFELKLLNGDQKPLDVAGWTLFWQLLDRDTAELKYITSVDIQESDLSRKAITISQGDLEPIKGGHYIYSSYLVSPSGAKTILYGDSQYGASVNVEVINNSFPQIYPSQIITDFLASADVPYVNPDTSSYSSAINARAELNNDHATHTIMIYSSNFKGSVDIQATLENGVTAVINWAVVGSVNLTEMDSLSYKNFVGVYTWIRFHVKPDQDNSGTVDKILYRS